MHTLYHHRGYRAYLGLLVIVAIFFLAILLAGATGGGRLSGASDRWLFTNVPLWSFALLLGLFGSQVLAVLGAALFNLSTGGLEARLKRALRWLLVLAPLALLGSDLLAGAGPAPWFALAPTVLSAGAGCLGSGLLFVVVMRTFRKARSHVSRLAVRTERLRGQCTEQSLRRLQDSIDYARGLSDHVPFQQHRGFQLADLPSVPWYERADFPWMAAFERNYSDIRQEALRVCGGGGLPDYGYQGYVQGTWTSYWLMGPQARAAAVQCPATIRALRAVPGFPVFREAFFSVLHPRSRIAPHSDSTNLWVTAHLGIQIPEGCGLRVGRETRRWREGELLVFDTSYQHEAWNESEAPRIVLLFDFLHPALTEVERKVLAPSGR